MAVVPGVRSQWHRFVYDTVTIAAGAAAPNPIQFFVNPIGSGTSPTVGSGGKQIQDTNIVEARKLPWVAGDGWIKSIRLVVTGATAPATPLDCFKLFKSYILTFLVNNTEYIQAPLDCFPAGGGPSYQGQLSTAMLALTTTSFGMQNGLPSASAQILLDPVIPIGQGENFEGQLNGVTFTADAAGGTTLGTGLILRYIIEGQFGKAANQ